MADPVKAACIQFTSGPDIKDNLARIAEMVREAAGQGARLIATPENSDMMRFPAAEALKAVPEEEDHPMLTLCSALARKLDVWIVLGSIKARVGRNRLANRSYVFNGKGEVATVYDKIHLFDVDLPTGESHRESATIRPGERAVTARTPFGMLGLSVCYDVRFPQLYRALAKAGAQILTVPAAFTVPTGQAHWEVLLRARAIETGSFVLAPAQTGEHQGGRKTWGHSMIVGPWGEILAAAGKRPGIITADLDPAAVLKARSAIPALVHDRSFEGP